MEIPQYIIDRANDLYPENIRTKDFGVSDVQFKVDANQGARNAYIAGRMDQEEWIDVKITLPPKATLVLFLVGEYSIYIGALHHGYFQVWGQGREPINDMDVTHWLPLPKTPAEILNSAQKPTETP